MAATPTTSQNEQTPLLTSGKPVAYVTLAVESSIDIQPLRYRHVPNVTRRSLKAYEEDSIYRYYKAADPSPFFLMREKVNMHLNLSDVIRRRRGFTIEHGHAICLYRPSWEQRGKLVSWLKKAVKWTEPRELAKRKKEYNEMAQCLARSAFGKKINDMIELQSLAVSRKRQGRGYGTALVNAVHRIADEQRLAVWLVTSDADRFYERRGYKKVREQWVGLDNPAWNGPPVPVRIMVREPQSGEKSSRSNCGQGEV